MATWISEGKFRRGRFKVLNVCTATFPILAVISDHRERGLIQETGGWSGKA
jgi:hypothetical protein